jgi:hypothetical protein
MKITDEQTTMELLDAMTKAIPHFKTATANQKAEALRGVAFQKTLLEITGKKNIAEALVEMRRLVAFQETEIKNANPNLN